MKNIIFWLVPLSIILIPIVAGAQDSTPGLDQRRGQIEPPGRVELAKHQQALDPPQAPHAANLDARKLRREAEEMSNLAQSVSADMAQINQGKLPKDLADKLKRIEKLSKHLHGELAP